eukprot:TRINITY_DN2590_c0_g1_i1.p1 TRINITY_DN2590_c0_g1~~TRINITY_DN2590_c0_g1_i1.p1  ORF type:complete len:207 (-),score=67.29 TRINITY_DN2590_c0_g1_i1:271-891(-)
MVARRSKGVFAAAAFAVGALWASGGQRAAENTFIAPRASEDASGLQRREALAMGASLLPAMLGADGAHAISRITDRVGYVNRRKYELVPYFKQGLDYFEKKGYDDRMKLFLPRMVNKMKIYAAIFSETDAPDKNVRRLEKDTDKFRRNVEAGDVAGAKAAFEQYRVHIPPGYGTFDLDKPETFDQSFYQRAPKLPEEAQTADERAR